MYYPLTNAGYYQAEMMKEGENPPIGLVLCASKNEAVVKYTLSQTHSRVFASRYQLHLPSEQELAEELRRGRQALEEQGEGNTAAGGESSGRARAVRQHRP